jgi:hypothetical protein
LLSLRGGHPSAIRVFVEKEGSPATYFADPVSSKERPLSNLAMSASNSDEVLMLDKREGDVMEKKLG